MFGDLKYKGEEGFEGSKDGASQELNEENMNYVVETIFRKAQNEKEYCNFYGDLCEKIIRLELALRGHEAKLKTITLSNFRKALLDNCKKSFNQFFLKEMKDKDKTMD
jgi:hypothetical protein